MIVDCKSTHLCARRQRQCSVEPAGRPLPQDVSLLIDVLFLSLLTRDDEAVALDVDLYVLLLQARELDSRGDEVRLGRLVDVHFRLEGGQRALLVGVGALSGGTLAESVIDETVEVVEGEEGFVELERHCGYELVESESQE